MKSQVVQVHDLLHLRSDSWVVVRRSPAPHGQIAVGIRGDTRSDRRGAFVGYEEVDRIVRPEDLRPIRSLRTPASRTLLKIGYRWRELTIPWGPIGSCGFELASGSPVTNEVSDLDLVIRAPETISQERARCLWECTLGLEVRVDVRIETPACGFALEEYARAPSRRILLRYASGPRLGCDPWNEPPEGL